MELMLATLLHPKAAIFLLVAMLLAAFSAFLLLTKPAKADWVFDNTPPTTEILNRSADQTKARISLKGLDNQPLQRPLVYEVFISDQNYINGLPVSSAPDCSTRFDNILYSGPVTTSCRFAFTVTGAEDTSFFYLEMSSNIQRYFVYARVQKDKAGNSGVWSAALQVNNPTTPRPPGNFRITSVTPGCSGDLPRMNIAWTASQNATSYKIFRYLSLDAGGWVEIATVDPSLAFYVDTNLMENTTYRYHIRATGGTEPPAFSGELTATTLACGDYIGPTIVTPTSMCNGYTPRISILWSAEGANWYYLVREEVDNPDNYVSLTPGGTPTPNSVDDTVVAGIRYRYRVSSVKRSLYSYGESGIITAKDCSRPSVRVSADDPTVSDNQSTNIRWGVDGTYNSCEASGSWQNAPASGTYRTPPLSKDSSPYTYTLRCYNPNITPNPTSNPPIVNYGEGSAIVSVLPPPDLSPTEPQASGTLQVGERISFDSIVKNLSDTPAGPSKGRFCVGAPNGPACSARGSRFAIGPDVNIASIAGNGEQIVQTNSLTPWMPTSSGSYMIWFCADVDDVINEASEDNNCAVTPTGLNVANKPPFIQTKEGDVHTNEGINTR